MKPPIRSSSLFLVMLLLASTLGAAELPLGPWRQIDAGRPKRGHLTWVQDATGFHTTGKVKFRKNTPHTFRSFYVSGPPEAGDYVFRSVFTRQPIYDAHGMAEVEYGIVVRFQDQVNYYAVVFSGKGPMILQRVQNGQVTELASSPDFAPMHIDNYIEVETLGSLLMVRLNGRMVFEATDDQLSAGQVGCFVCRDAPLRFRDIHLYEGSSAPPVEVPLLLTLGPYVLWAQQNQAMVAWQTNRPVDAVISYGPAGTPLDQSLAVPVGPLMQKVPLDNLIPGVQYAFRIDANGQLLGEGAFHTDAGPGGPFVAGFIGNTKIFPDRFARFNQRILAQKPQFVMHLGDMISDSSRLDEWAEYWFVPGRSLFAAAPVYVAVGDHDCTPNRRWLNYFLPYPGAGTATVESGKSGFFAFTYGDAAFLVIDNYITCAPTRAQHLWIQETLGSEAFQRARWRIVCAHEAPWSVGRRKWRAGSTEMRDYVLPLCQKYGVQLLIAGHDPTYKRGRAGDVNIIMNGGGGCGYGERKYAGGYNYSAKLLRFAILQYSMMKVEGNRLEWTCYTPDNKVLDHFVLRDGQAQPFEQRGKRAPKTAGGGLEKVYAGGRIQPRL